MNTGRDASIVLIVVAVLVSIVVCMVVAKPDVPADALMADSEKGVAGLSAPDDGAVGAAPKMADVPFTVQPLVAVTAMPWGLVKLTVDGRTFLLYSDRHGTQLVQYEPAAQGPTDEGAGQ